MSPGAYFFQPGSISQSYRPLRTQPSSLSSWGTLQTQATVMELELWVGGGRNTGNKWWRKHPQNSKDTSGEKMVSWSDQRGSYWRSENQPNLKRWSLPVMRVEGAPRWRGAWCFKDPKVGEWDWRRQKRTSGIKGSWKGAYGQMVQDSVELPH